MFFTFDWFEPVWTGFLRFFAVPVRSFWILGSSRTGLVLGPSKNTKKPDRTGPHSSKYELAVESKVVTDEIDD